MGIRITPAGDPVPVVIRRRPGRIRIIRPAEGGGGAPQIRIADITAVPG